jgi:polysaccharide biosynthesis/export protein
LVQNYASELKKPEVTLILKSFSFQKVLVDGEVMFPGAIDLKGPTTVMNAIAQAKGARETARLSNIIVIRKDFNGKTAGTNVDLTKVIDGTDFSQDITLMPYDIVYVPKSNIARVDKFMDEYFNRVMPLGAISPFLSYYAVTNVNH